MIQDMQYDVVFLDWDGTLSGSKFWGQWASDRQYGNIYDFIQKDFFKLSPDLVNKWLLGSYSAEEVTKEIAKKAPVAPGDLLQALKESCEAMEFFDKKLLDVVARLRQAGIMVVIATDNMDVFTRWTVPALQLDHHFDAALNSFSLKALKKDKNGNGQSKFFSAFLDQHKINPARTILIDDSADAAVVKEFGMQFAQVTPSTSALTILDNLS